MGTFASRRVTRMVYRNARARLRGSCIRSRKQRFCVPLVKDDLLLMCMLALQIEVRPPIRAAFLTGCFPHFMQPATPKTVARAALGGGKAPRHGATHALGSPRNCTKTGSLSSRFKQQLRWLQVPRNQVKRWRFGVVEKPFRKERLFACEYRHQRVVKPVQSRHAAAADRLRKRCGKLRHCGFGRALAVMSWIASRSTLPTVRMSISS